MNHAKRRQFLIATGALLAGSGRALNIAEAVIRRARSRLNPAFSHSYGSVERPRPA